MIKLNYVKKDTFNSDVVFHQANGSMVVLPKTTLVKKDESDILSLPFKHRGKNLYLITVNDGKTFIFSYCENESEAKKTIKQMFDANIFPFPESITTLKCIKKEVN